LYIISGQQVILDADLAATVLNSSKAVQMSLFVVRAFVKMREQISTRSDWESRVLQIENVLLAHDDQLRDLYEKIRPLLLPPPERNALWTAWLKQAQRTNERDRALYSHGVFTHEPPWGAPGEALRVPRSRFGVPSWGRTTENLEPGT